MICLESIAVIPGESTPYIAVAADGHWAAADRDYVLWLDGASVSREWALRDVRALALSKDERALLAAPSIIDLGRGEREVLPSLVVSGPSPDGGADEVVAAAFDGNGDGLIVSIARIPGRGLGAKSVGPSHRILWLDGRTRALRATLFESILRHDAVAVSDDGVHLAASATDVLRFDPDLRGGYRMTTLTHHEYTVLRLVFAPGRSGLLASGDAMGNVALWTLGENIPTFAWKAHAGPVGALAWHRDGWLLTGGREGELRAWRDGALVSSHVLGGQILGAAFDHGGRFLAVAIGAPSPRLELLRLIEGP